MLRLIGLLAVLSLGAAGALAWDRHPAWGVHLRVLMWRPGFDLPPSLAQQRDAALRAAQDASDGLGRCNGALTAQSASLKAVSAGGAARLAKSQHDVDAVKAVNASLLRSAASLRAYVPKGADACSRWDDADRAVTEALK